MNSVSALKSLRSVAPAFTGQSRSYAKATLIGGLIAVPEERQTTAGKNYFMYRIACPRPVKVDAEGNVQRDENGYPVRESDYHTIFNFRDRAAESLPQLIPGSQILVEAAIATRPNEIDGKNYQQTTFTEITHRVLSKPRKTEEQASE